jgi:adenylate cyclase
MFTDMVGFSRQMSADEARMLRLLDTHNQIIRQAVAAHHGTVIKTVGDAFLVDFPSVVHAVQCAQQLQHQFLAHNAEKEAPEQIHVRIGIHLGDIVQRDGDVFGDGVNVASRLQELAAPDTVCISHVVYKEVEKKVGLGTVVSLGQPKLKNIAERFPVYALLPQPPRELRQRLRVQRLKLRPWQRPLQVAAALLLLLGAGIIGRYIYVPSPSGLPLPDKPSIVVLPFANMSNEPQQEYFSDGITEDITTDLSRISSLFVIARNSAFTYKGKAAKVQDVSREMGVRYVLEGSVRKADNQVRITAQLIDGTTGGHLWAERYDRPLKDIFTLQDEIVQRIVTTLKLQLSLWEQGRLARKRTDNPEAYDSYLRGLEAVWRALSGSKEANTQARQLFERAMELAPTYAEACARLGMTYWIDWFYQWNPTPQTLTRAGEMAQRAITLDESLAAPHEVLGVVYLWKKQHAQAIAEAERAIALDPNAADGYVNLANILTFAERPEEAIGLIEKAMRLNPQYPSTYVFYLSFAYRVAGRYDEALVPLKKVLSLNPNDAPAHVNLAACYVELDRMQEAQAEAAEILRLFPKFSLEVAKQIWPYKNPADLERYLAALRKAGLK